MSVSADRINGLMTSVAVKAPVRTVSTGPLTLSGLQTVNGVALAEGDRVLVKDQVSAVDNGIYDASTSAWTRSPDFDGNRDVVDGTVLVVNFSSGAGLFYRTIAPDPVVIGSSEITFEAVADPNLDFPQSAAEATAGITPSSTSFPDTDPRRYGRDFGDQRISPSLFSWAGILPTISNGPGTAQWTEDVAAWTLRTYTAGGLVSSGVCYVDPVNGSDANTGGISDPVLTLSYAVRSLFTTQIYCLPGVYAPFDYRITDAPASRLKVVTALGPCYIRNAVDDPVTATWTADGTFPGVFWMPLTPANPAPCTVLDLSRLDIEGQPIPLEERSSIANCNTVNIDPNNSHGSWFYDSGANRLYVRMGGLSGTAFRSRLKVVTGTSTTRLLVLGVPLLMIGDWHLEGVYPFALQSSGTRAFFMMQCPKSKAPNIAYTASAQPCWENEGSTTLAQGVWAHRAKIDNFHYVDSGGVQCRGIEINCRSTFAGDYLSTRATTADGTHNASSAHDTGSMIRINGEYLYSDGPDLPDACTGGTWDIGCICSNDAGGQGMISNLANSYGIYALGGTLWADACSARSHQQKDLQADNSINAGAKIKRFNTSYRTSGTASTATISAYLPQVPGT